MPLFIGPLRHCSTAFSNRASLLDAAVWHDLWTTAAPRFEPEPERFLLLVNPTNQSSLNFRHSCENWWLGLSQLFPKDRQTYFPQADFESSFSPTLNQNGGNWSFWKKSVDAKGGIFSIVSDTIFFFFLFDHACDFSRPLTNESSFKEKMNTIWKDKKLFGHIRQISLFLSLSFAYKVYHLGTTDKYSLGYILP